MKGQREGRVWKEEPEFDKRWRRKGVGGERAGVECKMEKEGVGVGVRWRRKGWEGRSEMKKEWVGGEE